MPVLSTSTIAVDSCLVARFAAAVAQLDRQFAANPIRLDDAQADSELRRWLDAGESPLPWAGERVTADEWFFVTTLYGTMNRAGQKTHIRKFFPRFVTEAGRDIRNFTPSMLDGWSLRSAWMKPRLYRMARVLKEREQTMVAYSEWLRELERSASCECPSPALEQIKQDCGATGWKTLSIFVRDCIGGNCFPIDTRVARELARHELPQNQNDEELLTRLALTIGHNPRQIARMFYESGGVYDVFD